MISGRFHRNREQFTLMRNTPPLHNLRVLVFFFELLIGLAIRLWMSHLNYHIRALETMYRYVSGPDPSPYAKDAHMCI